MNATDKVDQKITRDDERRLRRKHSLEASVTLGLGYGKKKRGHVEAFYNAVWPVLSDAGWTLVKGEGDEAGATYFLPPGLKIGKKLEEREDVPQSLLSKEDPTPHDEGTWDCLSCGHTNMAAKSRCNGFVGGARCMAWRGGKRLPYFNRVRDVIERVFEKKNEAEARAADAFLELVPGAPGVFVEKNDKKEKGDSPVSRPSQDVNLEKNDKKEKGESPVNQPRKNVNQHSWKDDRSDEKEKADSPVSQPCKNVDMEKQDKKEKGESPVCQPHENINQHSWKDDRSDRKAKGESPVSQPRQHVDLERNDKKEKGDSPVSQPHQNVNRYSWKDDRTHYKKASSRVGPEFHVNVLPAAGSYTTPAKSDACDGGALYERVWDPNEAEKSGKCDFVHTRVKFNRRESAYAMLHSRGYRLPGLYQAVSSISPTDCSDWSKEDEERFRSAVFEHHENMKEVSRMIGKPISECITHYLVRFKRTKSYKALKRSMRRKANASEGKAGGLVCNKCGKGGMLIACDTCEAHYHLACAVPPLEGIPDRTWNCGNCKRGTRSMLSSQDEMSCGTNQNLMEGSVGCSVGELGDVSSTGLDDTSVEDSRDFRKRKIDLLVGSTQEEMKSNAEQSNGSSMHKKMRMSMQHEDGGCGSDQRPGEGSVNISLDKSWDILSGDTPISFVPDSGGNDQPASNDLQSESISAALQLMEMHASKSQQQPEGNDGDEVKVKTKKVAKPKKIISEGRDDGISRPTEVDVLSGRGGGTNRHAGNLRFRDEARKLRGIYQENNTSLKMKSIMSQELVKRVKAYGGRFLGKGDDGLWYELDHVACRKKAAQALRENKWDLGKISHPDAQDDTASRGEVMDRPASANGHQDGQRESEWDQGNISHPDAQDDTTIKGQVMDHPIDLNGHQNKLDFGEISYPYSQDDTRMKGEVMDRPVDPNGHQDGTSIAMMAPIVHEV